MIRARKLTKSYANLVAVNSLDLDLSTGETLGVLGPNGAGKSTLIGMLSGLIQPDEGVIEFPELGAGKFKHALGLAPQDLSLYDELTAEENLRFFAKMFGLRGRQLQQRVAEALDFARLQDRRKDRVGTFSGGMKRRINLAAAIVHQPKILFLDEPTVGVDPQSRNHIFECIEQLKASGLSILYTTHYMEEAERLCDRIAIMDQGQLLACDTLAALTSCYGGDSLIRAELTPPVPDLPLPGELDGNHWQARSEDPIGLLAQLNNSGFRFRSMQVEQASLESIFLKLTGKQLRD